MNVVNQKKYGIEFFVSHGGHPVNDSLLRFETV
jgi:hypothetical protein